MHRLWNLKIVTAGVRLAMLWSLVFIAAVAVTSVAAADDSESTEEALSRLLPGMSAEKIVDSQEAQFAWEKLCRGLCVPGNEVERAHAAQLMAGKLGPNVSNVARIWLLRQLEYMGGAESVDAIAAALNDKDPLVRNAARRALTTNPAAAANAALVTKLAATNKAGSASKEDAAFKIGLLNALGHRADASSTTAVSDSLADANKDVVAAAARALGLIGTADAADALKKRRQASEGDLRLRLGNATLRCANTMLARGQLFKAKEVFTDLRGEKEAASVRRAAAHGLMSVADDWGAVKLIAGFLRGDDSEAAGVAAAQMADLNSVHVDKLVAVRGQMIPAHQVLLLQALELRADKKVMPAVVVATASGDKSIRVAALKALSTVGDASVVPLLLKALSKGGVEASAARDALEAVYGEGTDAAIIAALKKADTVGRRAMLIEILHRRRSVESVPALLVETKHADAEVRRRAMAALSQLAEMSDVPAMLEGVLSAEAGAERDEAEKAVMLLCNRLEDADRRADPVLGVYEKANAADQKTLLPLLGRIGGPQALEKLEVALKSGDKSLYDVGVRAICNWPNGDVAPRLLALFESSDSEKHKLQAMRAFIRVIALRNERPNEESLELLKKSMKMAFRDEERNLILSRVISAEIRSIEALRFVLPYLENPATAQMACRAIVGLSHHRYLRRPNQEEFNKALSEVIRLSDNPGLRDQARRYRSDL